MVIAGREEETSKQTATEISSSLHLMDFAVCDVSKPDDVPRLIETVVTKSGRIDSLLNVPEVNIRK